MSYVLAEPVGTALSLRRDRASAARKIQEIPLEGSIFVLDAQGGVKATIPRVR